MSIFLSDGERAFLAREREFGAAARLFAAMRDRATARAEAPSLFERGDSADWWHMVEEAVADAAMVYAVAPDAALGAWVRNVTTGVVRRPQADWVGPWFRDHSRTPPEAQLETAHLTRAVALAVDLAADAFPAAELDEARACLRQRAIPMALAHLAREREVHNHWCVIVSGLAVAAAVVDDRAALDRAAAAYALYCQAYQPDGTYAESLQYANYASLNMMTAYEACVRRDPSLRDRLPPVPYLGMARWAAHAHLYSKPLSGWGPDPVPRAINFGDSAAVFAPSPELLLHIAAAARESDPGEARAARWLFDATADAAAPAPPPHDRASFGFVNRPGYLALPLLAAAAGVAPASPAAQGMPPVRAFDCGDAIARDAWDGKTVVAVRTGGAPMHVVSHVHGDANGLIVAHNRERLLVDPGHSCYRSLVHDLECSSHTHNTCTFDADGPDGATVTHAQRGIANRRRAGDAGMEPPLPPRTALLLAAADGDVRVIASDAAGRYGPPIEQFTRLTILCGSHALFVVDLIRAARPVRTRWNWLLNNRDGRGRLEVGRPRRDHLTFKRGDAGVRLFHRGGGHFGGPQFAFVHDAYHPLPGQLGEGQAGSGLLVHWRDAAPHARRTTVHAVALDDAARIGSWSCEGGGGDGDAVTLTGRGAAVAWTVRVQDDGRAVRVEDVAAKRSWTIAATEAGPWRLG